MKIAIEVVVFSLYLTCFFGIGWNFYLLGKMWGTSDHIGKAANGALIKLALSCSLLFLSHGIANWGEIPSQAFKAPWLLIASVIMVVIGVILHWWRYRRKGSIR